MLKSSGQAPGIIDGVAAADNRVVRDLVWHLEPFLPVIGDFHCVFWYPDM